MPVSAAVLFQRPLCLLSLHSPALKRLELHIWLPNDHPPPPPLHTPGGKAKAPGTLLQGKGGGGGGAERLAGLLPSGRLLGGPP